VDAPVTMLRVYSNVPRCVGDDELPLRRGEVAIGHINGDALLALGTQAIGQQREVYMPIATTLGGFFDGEELVFEDRLRVIQQAANERAFASHPHCQQS